MSSDIWVTTCTVKKFLFCVLWTSHSCFDVEKKQDPDLPIVSRNNESKDPAKKTQGWVLRVFTYANGHK